MIEIENYILFICILIFILIIFQFLDIYDEENTIYVINNLDDIDPQEKRDPLPFLDIRNNPLYSEKDYEALALQNTQIYDIQKCQVLINKMTRCLSKNKKPNKRCQKYIEENAEEFVKCDIIINYNYSLEEQKKNIINFDFNNEIYKKDSYDYKHDYEKEKENENDNLSENDFFNSSKDNDDLNDENDINETNNKEESLIDEREKENFIMINKEDCIEYGLSKKDNNYIECKRYE